KKKEPNSDSGITALEAKLPNRRKVKMRQLTTYGETVSISFRRHLILSTAARLCVATVAAQTSDSDSVPLKNWAPSPVHPKLDSLAANQDPTTGLVFIAISPCRIADTRPQPFGLTKTGAFGPPALVGQQTRVFPIPQSNCGIPSSAAYSLNFTSVTPCV